MGELIVALSRHEDVSALDGLRMIRDLADSIPPSGVSGNPGGRPKNTLTAAYKKMLGEPFPDDPAGRTYAEVIAAAVGNRAALGDERPAKEIEDRVSGKARQTLTLTTDARQRTLLAADDLIEAARERGDGLDQASALQLLAPFNEDAALLLMELSSEANN